MAKKYTARHDSMTPFRHENHAKPVTRRQFLAQGFFSGAAFITAPSLLGFFGHSPAAYAQAAACGVATAAAGKIPFICLDLAGGANIAGSNVIVGGPGGQMDFLPPTGYKKLGLPDGMTPEKAGQVNTSLGLAFHSDSALLRGIQARTQAATQANVNGAVLCARSENDTGNNPHNPMYGINKAGADGALVNLVGNLNTDSGGNSQAPASMIDLSVRPTKVSTANDARGLVDTGRLGQILAGANEPAMLMQVIERLSSLKISKVNEGQMVADALTCAYSQSTETVKQFGSPDALDPTKDPLITQIFSATDLQNGSFLRTAAVMKLVINGFAGAGTVEFGGYDYHDGTRATGENKDFIAGQAIGAILQYAALSNKPVMIYVFSDGSLSSNGNIDNSTDGRGKGVWTSDSSSTAASFFLVYNPNGRAQLTAATKQQLGFYKTTGDLDTAATPISNNVNQLAEAVVLNYLALHNEVGRFAQVLPQNSLAAALNSLDEMVVFQPIA